MDNDTISRQAAIDIIKNHSYPVRYDGNSIEQGMTLTGIEQALKEVPSVQLEQKTGRWIETDDYDYDVWRCSKCKEYFYFDEGTPQDNQYYYCPCCGAKMESEVTE